MGNQTKKTELLIKASLIAVAGLVLTVFITISQTPPTGQWMKDSATQVFPSLRYGHPPLGPPRGLPRNDQDLPHSYFASPRFYTTRNNQKSRLADQSVQGSIAQAGPSDNDAQDLLSPGSMSSQQVIYSPAFGAAR